MRLGLVFLMAFFLAGCVATGQLNEKKQLSPEASNELASLRGEVERLRGENEQLKGKIAEFQQAQQSEVVRMPTASEIQSALKKAGYYKGEIDNQIGSATKEAIKKFQAANGITPDGVVGSRTWAALDKYYEKK